MSQTDALYRLQQIDTQIREETSRLSKVIRAQKESNELLQARQRAEEASAEKTTWQTRQTDLDLELKGLRSKLDNATNRLYSGKVKNPKELNDLQQSIESMNRHRAKLEDEVLEAMIMLEDAQEELAEASASLEEIETAWEKKQAALEAEKVSLAQSINRLNQERQAQAERIEPKLVKAYEQAAQRGAGLGVVLLKNNRCRGCQVTVPANLIRSVDQGRLVYCDSCGRILHLG